jgi:SAM-dependent methyltransferase
VAVKSDVKTGHDIAYVTRGHASGCAGAMAYYTRSGEPPGTWEGRGTAALGVSGTVEAEIAERPYQQGVGPGGERIIQHAAPKAAALGVTGDATRLPIADQSIDGVISVEAAFHFRSRRAFFDECFRVLKPGGVLSISDIATERLPLGPLELLAGITQMRIFGLRPSAAMTADQIAEAAHAAGFTAVDVTVCGDLVIAPALQLIGHRLRATPTAPGAPTGQRTAARLLLSQVELLWRRQIIQYILLRAVRP